MKERKITSVNDLNIGDLATFMEITMPMEIHPDYSWDQYPNLNHLYAICSQIEGFDKIHEPFLKFCKKICHHRQIGTTPTLVGWIKEICVGARMIMRVLYVQLLGKFQF